MVGPARFELTTSCTPCKRSTKLNYGPMTNGRQVPTAEKQTAASVNQRKTKDRVPQAFGASKKVSGPRTDLVRLLLEHRSPVNLADRSGSTALHTPAIVRASPVNLAPP
jgi:hypothetical protein